MLVHLCEWDIAPVLFLCVFLCSTSLFPILSLVRARSRKFTALLGRWCFFFFLLPSYCLALALALAHILRPHDFASRGEAVWIAAELWNAIVSGAAEEQIAPLISLFVGSLTTAVSVWKFGAVYWRCKLWLSEALLWRTWMFLKGNCILYNCFELLSSKVVFEVLAVEANRN